MPSSPVLAVPVQFPARIVSGTRPPPTASSEVKVAAVDEAKAAPRGMTSADAPKVDAPAPHPFDAAPPRPMPGVAAAQQLAPAPAARATPAPVSTTDQATAPPAEQLGSIPVTSARAPAGDPKLTMLAEAVSLAPAPDTITLAPAGASPAPPSTDTPAAPDPDRPASFSPVLVLPVVSQPQILSDTRPPSVATNEVKVIAVGGAKAAAHPTGSADEPKAEAAAPQPFDAAAPRPTPVLATVQPLAPAPVERITPRPVSTTDQAKAPPAEQLGSILVASTRAPAGNQQLTVRLDPPELGRVHIAIAQPRTGAAAVTLTVERPETLLMVLRDAPALHRALDRAGVPAEARTVTFELAPQRTASPQGPHAQNSPSSGPGFDLASRDQWQRPARQMPERNEHGTDIAHNAEEPIEDQRARYKRMWQRAGIDITA